MFGFTFGRTTPAATPAAPGLVAEPMPSRHRLRMRGIRTAVRSLFKSASTDRLTSTWGGTPLTADDVVMREQRTLVARSREQATNNDYCKAFIRMCRQNIVGPQGIQLNAQVMNSQGKLDVQTNEALEWAFFEWSKPENADVKGRQSFREIQKSAVNSAARDGEYMVRLVWGADAGPWGFALQTLDPQRCPVDMNVDRHQGGFIRHGIHFNQFGRPLAYYFTTTRETDEAFFYGGKAHERIPAEELIHGFVEDMVGQKRGLPWMATGLFRMRHLNGLEDAAVINARIGAAKMGFIQWKEGFGPQLEDGEEIPEISAEAGVFETLPEGAELKEWNPQYPSGEFAPFAKHLLRGAAAGFGVPYNELAADLEGVNFSSIRQGTLDSRESWKDLQEWLMEGLMSRVYAAWLPRADVDAATNSKNNMLASPSAIIREQGKDPLAVWRETARDLRSMIDAMVAEGIPQDKATELVMLSMGKQPEKPQPPAAPAAKKKETAE